MIIETLLFIDKLEMGIFVDAVEDPDQLTSIENPEVEPNPKVTSLKNKLGKIYRKRAAIRTKKVLFFFFCIYFICNLVFYLKKIEAFFLFFFLFKYCFENACICSYDSLRYMLN